MTEKTRIDWLEESYDAVDDVQKCREDTLLSSWFVATCEWAAQKAISQSPAPSLTEEDVDRIFVESVREREAGTKMLPSGELVKPELSSIFLGNIRKALGRPVSKRGSDESSE